MVLLLLHVTMESIALTIPRTCGPRCRVKCLEYLGVHFRIIMDLPARLSDLEVLLAALLRSF